MHTDWDASIAVQIEYCVAQRKVYKSYGNYTVNTAEKKIFLLP